MKKFLLMALAAFTVGTANAQLAQKQATKRIDAKHVVAAQTSIKKYSPVAALAVKPVLDKTAKRFSHSSVGVKDLKSVSSLLTATPSTTYNAYGTGSDGESASWEMTTGTATLSGIETTVITNVLPNIFGFEGGVTVPYTLEGDQIIIKPTLLASTESKASPTGMLYIFLESATSDDGSITLTLKEDGSIDGKYTLLYGCYPNETYNFEEYLGYYERYSNVSYLLPGVVAAPAVSFESQNLILFAGLGLNGYSFNNNLAMTGAYATTTFANRTTDPATQWAWTAYDASQEEETVFAMGTKKDFALNLTNNTISNVSLVGTNGDASSEPFIFGVGKTKDEETGDAKYTDCYVYAGNTESSFNLNDETNAIMTRQDPDGDLTFYTNWATPDKASNSMSKIYLYHEKPASPLYIEGVTLPMVGFSANEDFNLKIIIRKVDYTGTKPVLGDTIAAADATTDNVNANFTAGLTAVEFDELYVEDEDGLTVPIDHLFLDTEFMIIIEGWDNGTFSGVLGSQDAPLDNARTSTWFEMTGAAGSMYSYTTWKTSLFVGLLGATYGYLHTSDDTNVTIPTEGGQASISVEPMFSNTEADESGSKTRLFLDEESDAIPEWLTVGFANEQYDETASKFDLVFRADALPDGMEGREVNLVFFQEGARLKVTVVQGASDGIDAVKAVKSNNGAIYNLAGQRVSKNFKGLIVKDGKKFIVK